MEKASMELAATRTSAREGDGPRLRTNAASIFEVTGSLRTFGFASLRWSPASVAHTNGDEVTGG